jgi:hypothetical protein
MCRSPPGGFGFGNGWLLCRELIFEQARPAASPSRMSSSFVLPTLDDAKKYRASVDGNFQQVLHEVEIMDERLPQHRGALSFLDMQDGAPFLDPTRLRAIQYWKGDCGDPERGYELVTASSLRVIKALD